MSASLLEAYTRTYLAAVEDDAEVAFTWQGGEPTLAGLDFFKHAVALQHRYGRGRRITNSLQTNGLLLDDQWCRFLSANGFLVGLSLDGPAHIHDTFRHTPSGGPSHARAMHGLRLLQQHQVAYNVLACVNSGSSRHSFEVYDFLRSEGVVFIQFIPIVERLEEASATGLALHSPERAAWPLEEARKRLTPWSVEPLDYGKFLTSIFDVWVKQDVGAIFVMNFEWALANYMGQPGTVCHHQPTCGRSLVLEHTGEVFACDHYVYPQFRRGSFMQTPLADLVDTPEQEQFGRDKYEALSDKCKRCPMLKGCWGGCPKHRIVREVDEKGNTSYLCAGYYHYFGHIVPRLKVLSQLLKDGRPASEIMNTEFVYVFRG